MLVCMSIFRVFGDLAGIAKGMSVTLREMFSPTIVEVYPNKKLASEERFSGTFPPYRLSSRRFAQTAR
jgi:formate hydrogenlyase subunit 6/NADH:ubiquinone oxidoreductase subunit I